MWLKNFWVTYKSMYKSMTVQVHDRNKVDLLSPVKSQPLWITNFVEAFQPKRIEYILEGNLLEKKCKTAILLCCFHTAGVLHIFMLYKLLGPGISFYRKSKINVKSKPNYEIGWFHNWPMIISHRLYAFHFTNDDFPL